MSPRVLTIDIETSPNVADVWSLWQQNVSLKQLRDTTRVICWAAKWADKEKIEFRSEFHHGHEAMIAKAWELLDAADIIVTYNGKRFDVPHLHREFLLQGAGPPSPSEHVDLLASVRARFRFASNKLDHVTQQLGIGSKVEHEGHELWVKCLAGDRSAWDRMRTYCKHDVALTEKLHQRLTGWLKAGPNLNLYRDGDKPDGCPHCGKGREFLVRRGLAPTRTAFFPRFSCKSCGGWSQGKNAVDRVDVRAVAA